jgi:hypothetical protein
MRVANISLRLSPPDSPLAVACPRLLWSLAFFLVSISSLLGTDSEHCEGGERDRLETYSTRHYENLLPACWNLLCVFHDCRAMVGGDSGSEVLPAALWRKTLVVRYYSVRFPNFYILTRFLFADCNHFFSAHAFRFYTVYCVQSAHSNLN